MFIPMQCNFTQLLLYWTKNTREKRLQIATIREFTTNSICSKLNFTRESVTNSCLQSQKTSQRFLQSEQTHHVKQGQCFFCLWFPVVQSCRSIPLSSQTFSSCTYNSVPIGLREEKKVISG